MKIHIVAFTKKNISRYYFIFISNNLALQSTFSKYNYLARPDEKNSRKGKSFLSQNIKTDLILRVF